MPTGGFQQFNTKVRGFGPRTNPKQPPTFLGALNRLSVTDARNTKWVQFPAQCPVASFHRIKPWTDPDKCPRCGIYLEKNALPFRIWE
jgi:hypothetical protein